MILVLAGTKEGREIVKELAEKNYRIMASVVSDYGYRLLADYEVDIIQGRLDREGLSRVIEERKVNLIVDATHPFAHRISENAQQVTTDKNIAYLRYERPGVEVTEKELLIRAGNYHRAAEQADNFNRILLTTGSSRVDCFLSVIEDWQKKLLFRVLPLWKRIKRLQEKGVSPQQIIALQGPVSEELNRSLLEDYEVEVLVTKASGPGGGVKAKLVAAFSLKIPVIMIERPDLNYRNVVSDYENLWVEIETLLTD